MSSVLDIYPLKESPGMTFAEPVSDTPLTDIFKASAQNTLIAGSNVAAGWSARDEAYDNRIRAIKAQTGIELENPQRGGYIHEAAPVIRGRIQSGEVSYLDRHSAVAELQQRIFDQKVGELQVKHPDLTDTVTGDIDTEARALAAGSAQDLARATKEQPGNPILKFGAEMAGGMWGSRRDPLFIGSLFAGPTTAVGKTAFAKVASAALNQGLFNAGLTAIELPAVQAWHTKIGQETGVWPAMQDVGLAFLTGAIGGAVTGGAVEGLKAAATPLRRLMAGRPEPGDVAKAWEHLGPPTEPPRELAAKEGSGEAPVASGMTRLYRGETAGGPSAAVPDYVRETPEFQATVEATGRWFTASKAEAQHYAEVHGTKGNKVTYVDVPTADVEKYLSANQPGAKKFSAAGRENEEFFLPREIADSRRDLDSRTMRAGEGSAESVTIHPQSLPPELEGEAQIYDIHQGGQKVGQAAFSNVGLPEGETNLMWIGRGAEPEGEIVNRGDVNTLGPKVMRRALREYQRLNPEITKIHGTRISGARAPGIGEAPEISINLRTMHAGEDSLAADRAVLTAPAPKDVPEDLHHDLMGAALKRADDPSAPSPEAVATVYHGTNRQFEAFDAAHLQSSSGSFDAGHGFYFTDDREVASFFADNPQTGRIIEANLDIKNPLTIDLNEFRSADPMEEMMKAGPEKNETVKQAFAAGHDAVIFKNSNEGKGPVTTTFVVKNTDQIKQTGSRPATELLDRIEQAAPQTEAEAVLKVASNQSESLTLERSEFSSTPGYETLRILDPDGNRVGLMVVNVENPKDIRISHVASDIDGKMPFGVSGIRQLSQELQKLYPELETVSGRRVSGARNETVEVTQQLRRSTELQDRIEQANPQTEREAHVAADEALDDFGRRDGMSALQESIDRARTAEAETIKAAQPAEPEKPARGDPMGKIPFVGEDGAVKMLTEKAAAALGERQNTAAMLVRSCV